MDMQDFIAKYEGLEAGQQLTDVVVSLAGVPGIFLVLCCAGVRAFLSWSCLQHSSCMLDGSFHHNASKCSALRWKVWLACAMP